MQAPRMAAELHVSGRVQGVGFRAFASRRAVSLGLVGYVMNLGDGRVRLHVEGNRPVIDELVRDVEKGPPLARVEGVAVRWLPASGRFTGFGVRLAAFEP